MRCACHALHTALKTAYRDVLYENAEMNALDEGARSLVEYLARSELKNKLRRQITQSTVTRWSTLHAMMKSILGRSYSGGSKLIIAENSTDIHDVLTNHNSGASLRKFTALDRELMQQLVDVVEFAAVKMSTWQANTQPTIQLVLGDWRELIDHVNVPVNNNERAGITSFRRKLIKELKRKCPVSLVSHWQMLLTQKTVQLHQAATVLTPSRRRALAPFDERIAVTTLISTDEKGPVRQFLWQEMLKVGFWPFNLSWSCRRRMRHQLSMAVASSEPCRQSAHVCRSTTTSTTMRARRSGRPR